MSVPRWPPSYEKLRALTDDELVKLYDDDPADHKFERWHVIQELSGRRVERATATMVRVTWWIFWLTLANAVLVAVSIWKS